MSRRTRRYCEGEECGHNRIFLGAIVSLIVVTLVSATLLSESPIAGSLSYVPVDNMPWTTQVSIQDASVGAPGGSSYTVTVGQYTTQSSLPPQLGSIPSGTSIDIDPDRISGETPPKYYFDNIYYRADGPLPEVLFGITSCWRTDNNGVKSNTYAEKQPDGRYLYNFMVSAGMHTTVSPSTKLKTTGDPAGVLNMAMYTYETAMAQAVMHLKIHVQPPTGVSAENFTASWGGASVFWSHAVTLDTNNVTHVYAAGLGTVSDDPAYVPSDTEINQGIGGFSNTLGAGGGDIFLQLTAKMQAGAVYTTSNILGSYWLTGLNNPINVGVSFMILFSVILSSPPTQPGIFAQIWIWIQDVFTVLVNPNADNWWIWIFLAAIFILVIVWLLRPKKKQQQAQTIQIVMPSQQPQLAKPEEKK